MAMRTLIGGSHSGEKHQMVEDLLYLNIPSKELLTVQVEKPTNKIVPMQVYSVERYVRHTLRVGRFAFVMYVFDDGFADPDELIGKYLTAFLGSSL